MPKKEPIAAQAQSRMSAEDRRKQLIEVAIDLFAKKGFNGTTTKEIAVAAGVTEAIIFRHFETKQQLYKAIIDYKVRSPQGAEWFAALNARLEKNDDEELFRSLIRVIIETHRVDPKFERLMIYAALEGNDIALLHMHEVTAGLVDQFRAYILRRQNEGALRKISPDAVLMALAGMAKHYALCRYIHELKDPHLSEEEAVEFFTRIIMEGLAAKRAE